MSEEQLAEILTKLRTNIEDSDYDFRHDYLVEAENAILEIFKSEIEKVAKATEKKRDKQWIQWFEECHLSMNEIVWAEYQELKTKIEK